MGVGGGAADKEVQHLMTAIGSRLIVAMAAVTVAAAVSVGWQAYSISRAALEAESFNKLIAVRELKADQVDAFFRTIRNQVIAMSANRMVAEAMVSMSQAFMADNVEEAPDSDAGLRLFYAQEFLERAKEAKAPLENVADLWPDDPRTLRMQHRYIASNPFPTGEKSLLERGEQGTAYDDLHAIYHPVLRDFSKRFGFYDLFMVDARTGYIVYSVEKEIDFATSLNDGPYRGTNMAEAFDSARAAANASFARMVDYESYLPSYGAQASFLASPIFANGQAVGVLIVQVPLDRLDEIMTSGREWAAVGLGETGETYIVGPDLTLRNQSRFLISDSESFFREITAAGVTQDTVDRIRSLGSSVGLLKIDTPGTRAALNGDSGTQIFDDYRGEPVLSAYRALDIPDVRWAIMSERDQTEAFAEAERLRNLIVATVLVTALIAVALAWLISRNLIAPLRALGESANRLAEGDLEAPLKMDRGDEIGELARSFERMRLSIQELVRRQESAIEALATPMIPFRKEILIVPMVGFVDQLRVEQLRESLVAGVHQQGARVAIIDLTGVPAVNADCVEDLGRMVDAVGLLGAAVVLTGLRPEIAAQWADQEGRINNAVSERSLERGIARAFKMIEAGTGHDIDTEG
jgi:HAMP domain-containing protein/anti-anti-sigma regulatory factor